jgi:hypothetical protein
LIFLRCHSFSRRAPAPTSPRFLTPAARKQTKRQSFTSAFVWLAALVVASLILLPLSPLASLPARIVALATTVAVEAAAARGLWRLDRRLLCALATAAAASPGHRPPDGGDAAALALAHGLAHGGTHALLLYLAWLPVSAGGRTLYAPACRAASVFGGGAVASAAGVALHAGTALLAWAGWDDGNGRLVKAAFGAHAAFAAASLLNTLPGGGGLGCVAGLGLGVAIGVGTLVAAFRVERDRAAVGAWRRPVGWGGVGRGSGRREEQAQEEGGG